MNTAVGHSSNKKDTLKLMSFLAVFFTYMLHCVAYDYMNHWRVCKHGIAYSIKYMKIFIQKLCGEKCLMIRSTALINLKKKKKLPHCM